MHGDKPDPSTPILLRAPLALAAVLMGAGIAAGLAWEPPRTIWPALAVTAVVVALLTARRGHMHLLTAGLIGVAIFGAGAWRADQCYRGARGDDIVLLTGTGQSLATVRGQVVSIPQTVEDDLDETSGYRRGPRTCLTLRVGEVLTTSGWRGASGLTSVIVQEADDRLRPGQELELLGWLGRQRGPDNPGQYDWSAAARRRGVMSRLSVMGPDGVTIVSGPRNGFARTWWTLRSSGRPAADLGEESSNRDLLAALVVGDRPRSLGAFNRTMARSGLAHYMSISGSHLVVLLGMVYLACRLAGLSPRPAAAAVLVVLVVYLLQADLRSPLLRSAMQAAAVCVGVMLGRRSSVLNSLAVAAIVLLAIDPMDLSDPGFQLSFGIVAALVLAQRPVKQMLFGRFLRRRGLVVFRGDQRVRRWLNLRAADWGMDAVAMALTAYVASAPLVAWHFGFFSPYAAVLTLAALPLVTAVLVPGYLALLAGPLTPNLAHQLNALAAGFAGWLDRGAGLLARLPFLAIDLRPVGPGWVVLTYALLAMLLLGRRLGLGLRVLAPAVIVWIGLTAWTQRTAPPPSVAELNVLAVGGGQCAVLRCPSGRTFLLDAGTRSGFNVYQQALGPFLQARRLPRPDTAFISHANTDHYNAIPSYLSEHRLGRVYTSRAVLEAKALAPDATASANHLLARLWDSGADVRTLGAGQKVDLDERTTVEVLWPPEGYDPASANDSSLVLRVTCDQRSALVCGDIQEGPQRALLEKPERLRCDVLVLPHHGSWEPSLPEFVAACGAQVVLASSPADPCAAIRSDPAAVAFYRQLAGGGRFHCTARDGWIGARFGRGVLDVQTSR